MDAVFGHGSWRNEIIWQRTSSHNDPKRYGRIHDSIFYYGKGDSPIWNQIYEKPDADFYDAHDFETDENGQLYRKRDLTAPYRGGPSGQYKWKGRMPPKGRMWSYTHENMLKLEAERRIVYTRNGMPRLKIPVDQFVAFRFRTYGRMRPVAQFGCKRTHRLSDAKAASTFGSDRPRVLQ